MQDPPELKEPGEQRMIGGVGVGEGMGEGVEEGVGSGCTTAVSTAAALAYSLGVVVAVKRFAARNGGPLPVPT